MEITTGELIQRYRASLKELGFTDLSDKQVADFINTLVGIASQQIDRLFQEKLYEKQE